MRPTTRVFAPLVPLLAALLLAGCGGGGSSAGETGATSTGSSAGSDGKSGAYTGGFEICTGSTVEEVAAGYGVSPATADAVSDSIAEAVSGGTPRDAIAAKQGCLDAFEQSK